MVQSMDEAESAERESWATGRGRRECNLHEMIGRMSARVVMGRLTDFCDSGQMKGVVGGVRWRGCRPSLVVRMWNGADMWERMLQW
jgi:hypothetical protein